jgi:hypothetical protein
MDTGSGAGMTRDLGNRAYLGMLSTAMVAVIVSVMA